jgi:hypothetical protein
MQDKYNQEISSFNEKFCNNFKAKLNKELFNKVQLLCGQAIHQWMMLEQTYEIQCICHSY